MKLKCTVPWLIITVKGTVCVPVNCGKGSKISPRRKKKNAKVPASVAKRKCPFVQSPAWASPSLPFPTLRRTQNAVANRKLRLALQRSASGKRELATHLFFSSPSIVILFELKANTVI